MAHSLMHAMTRTRKNTEVHESRPTDTPCVLKGETYIVNDQGTYICMYTFIFVYVYILSSELGNSVLEINHVTNVTTVLSETAA